MSRTVFLDPLDVLFLRGNKLFGDPGSYGTALMPPWPSVAAGALRSRMLADGNIDLSTFARGEKTHPELGTPQAPGPFTVTAFHLGRRFADGRVETLYTPPADLVITEADSGAGNCHPKIAVRSLRPTALAAKLACSAPLPLLPVLAEQHRTKPATGYWLTEAGWCTYLQGQPLNANHLVHASELWSLDLRVGVGLDTTQRKASEGKLFSMQAIAVRQRHHRHHARDSFDVGFIVAIDGATPPQEGVVRLGGDGRAAAIEKADWQPPQANFEAIAQARRCRMVLTTPGIFPSGWLPTGANLDQRRNDGAIRFELQSVSGWIVSAAVSRYEVVSGWDLAQWSPKPAVRAAPAGSVWWLELDADVSAEALRKLVALGLWTNAEYDTNPRRAEGFNRIILANWNQ